MTKIIGGKIPPKEHAKLKVEDAIDNVLERLIFARLEKPREPSRPDCMFTPEALGPMWCWPGIKHDIGSGFFRPEDVNSPELIWPLRFGNVFESPNYDSLQCHWHETVQAKVLRGKYRLIGKYNVGLHYALIDKQGRMVSAVEYATWFQKRWLPCGRIRYDMGTINALGRSGGGPILPYRVRADIEADEQDLGSHVAMAQSMALTYRYIWGAQFSIDNSARLIIPSTPAGVLELFNDRDKPADVDRRAPLRHWVRQHVRQRSSLLKFSHVREHLRGITSFRWRGYDVVIRPAAFDEERNAALIPAATSPEA